MKYSIRNLAIATVLAASAGGVLAQQPQYGRDSVYAGPTQARADTAAEPRSGRDIVYTMASTTTSSRLTADVPGPQRYGRASVYATRFDNAGDLRTSQIDRADSDRGTN